MTSNCGVLLNRGRRSVSSAVRPCTIADSEKANASSEIPLSRTLRSSRIASAHSKISNVTITTSEMAMGTVFSQKELHHFLLIRPGNHATMRITGMSGPLIGRYLIPLVRVEWRFIWVPNISVLVLNITDSGSGRSWRLSRLGLLRCSHFGGGGVGSTEDPFDFLNERMERIHLDSTIQVRWRLLLLYLGSLWVLLRLRGAKSSLWCRGCHS